MNSSDDLSMLLQEWQPQVTTPGDFNRSVWSRIEAAESTKAPQSSVVLALFSWVELFTRPRIALSAMMMALGAGVALGSLQAHSNQEEQYFRSLNPYSFHTPSR